MIAPELGGSICTGIHGKNIAVGIGIIEAPHEGSQMWLFIIRIRTFPKADCTCLKVVISKLVGTKVCDGGIISGIGLLLKFGKCQHIKEVFPPVLFIAQHQVAK